MELAYILVLETRFWEFDSPREYQSGEARMPLFYEDVMNIERLQSELREQERRTEARKIEKAKREKNKQTVINPWNAKKS